MLGVRLDLLTFQVEPVFRYEKSLYTSKQKGSGFAEPFCFGALVLARNALAGAVCLIQCYFGLFSFIFTISSSILLKTASSPFAGLVKQNAKK
jgi:hypothetical protein